MDTRLLKRVLCISIVCVTTSLYAETLFERNSLTEGLFGLNDELADNGIEFGLGVTQIYQNNIRGGSSTHRKAGRYTGSYDIELMIDFEKLWDIEGASLYMLTEGGWSDGIDDSSIGSFFGVNGDAAGNEAIYIGELWVEQALWDNTLFVRIGKIDLTGGFECGGSPVAFDNSAFANDETSQFLNGGLINNPTIPFPDKSLAVAAFYNPSDFWYIGGGMADASPVHNARHHGFNTAFKGSKDYFYIMESGITPVLDSANGDLQGAYRLGMWFDPQPKGHSTSTTTNSGDTGMYISFDQMLWKENANPEDTQGIGTFFRYGYADPRKNDLTHFWSLGCQYQGPFEGRDDDVLGFGFARGVFSNGASSVYTDDHESAFEIYYSMQVTGWATMTPSIQYINNPGGDNSIDDAIVLGLRTQITF